MKRGMKAMLMSAAFTLALALGTAGGAAEVYQLEGEYNGYDTAVVLCESLTLRRCHTVKAVSFYSAMTIGCR